MDRARESMTLPQVCALQWQRCVDRADAAWERVNPGQILRISYESFVARPVEHVHRLSRFLGIPLAPQLAAAITSDVSAERVGRWRGEIDGETLDAVERLIAGTLHRHGYA
jgi:hypothetical protein